MSKTPFIPFFLKKYIDTNKLRVSASRSIIKMITSELNLLSNQIFYGTVNANGVFDYQSDFDTVNLPIKPIPKSLGIPNYTFSTSFYLGGVQYFYVYDQGSFTVKLYDGNYNVVNSWNMDGGIDARFIVDMYSIGDS